MSSWLVPVLAFVYSARFDRSADWLLEQCHRIRLAVGITGSLKLLFLAWLNCAAVELENLRE